MMERMAKQRQLAIDMVEAVIEAVVRPGGALHAKQATAPSAAKLA